MDLALLKPVVASSSRIDSGGVFGSSTVLGASRAVDGRYMVCMVCLAMQLGEVRRLFVQERHVVGGGRARREPTGCGGLGAMDLRRSTRGARARHR